MQIAFKHDGEFAVSDIIDNEMVVVNVSKEDVISGNWSYIDNIINKLKECNVKSKQKVLLIFTGYDDIPEEIYTITAIRKWVQNVIKKHPYFFYFLTPFENNAAIIAACLSDVQQVKIGPAMSLREYTEAGIDPQSVPKLLVQIDIPENLYKHIIYGTVQYAIKVQDPQSGLDVLAGIPGFKC